MEELNDSQEKMLTQFKKNVADILEDGYYYPDDILYKFLKSRKFHLKNTEKEFRRVHSNKLLFNLYEVCDKYVKPEVAQKYETQSFLGFAKDGTGVRYSAAGRLDFYGFIMSLSCTDLCYYFCYIMESDLVRLRQEGMKRGKEINEMTYIIDMEGFFYQQVMHKIVIEMGMDFLYIVQFYYPHIWRRILLINVPSFFHRAFNLFKPVMGSSILENIKMANREGSKSLLLTYVDEDVLPAAIGGTRVDSKGDPECKEFISYGGIVPEKYYSHDNQNLIRASDPGVKTVHIGARGFHIDHVVITIPGSIIRMKHRGENGSIATKLLFKELGSKSVEEELADVKHCHDPDNDNCKYKQLTVDIRSQLHCVQDEFDMHCPWAGLYIMLYDSSGNWFTSRKIYYSVSVIPPI